MKDIPKYTGLAEFARGVQKLANIYGNVPVFLEVNGLVAPFGIAVQESSLLGGESITFCGGITGQREAFTKGTVTE
ncbi:MAG: hypothetical protein J6Q22_10060 [Prevotella sp.]|nr:hypothetical protein [Prevotella sp.]